MGRNPFLFRGPIPTQGWLEVEALRNLSRNPFLFRGPIPTIWAQKSFLIEKDNVAIPSYSEVLFLLRGI